MSCTHSTRPKPSHQSLLSRFRRTKEAEAAALTRAYAQAGPPDPCARRSPRLSSVLRAHGPGAVIAEYKPASPSRGAIASDLTPEDAGRLFSRAGAAAASVLTDTPFFGSSLQALDGVAISGLPLLRKDFLIDPVQIQETAATPASAFLLIVRMFETDKELEAMFRAGVQAGLEPVVEVFDPRDLARAKALGAELILVNSRNLDTLEVNLGIHQELVSHQVPGEMWICASGLSTYPQVQAMAELGYAACLIGTSIMAASDRLQALQALTQGPGRTCPAEA